MFVINVVIFLTILVFCKGSANKYWVSHIKEAQLLTPHELTGQAEEHSSEVWKSCSCENTFCNCNAEFHGWNNRMINFNIENDDLKFRMEVYDDTRQTKKSFVLKDGLNCHELSDSIFDAFCVKPYGNISNPYWIHVCLQMGFQIEHKHAISLEFQCFKADHVTFNHTGIRFESPDLKLLNTYMFKYLKSSAQYHYVSKILLSFLVLLSFGVGMKNS